MALATAVLPTTTILPPSGLKVSPPALDSTAANEYEVPVVTDPVKLQGVPKVH